MTDMKKWKKGNHWIEIDQDRCNGLGNCARKCPAQVYQVINGKVNAEKIGECIECGTCQRACPFKAIISHWAWK
ncbi:MAG: 4Fe-4S binding protein [Promethearchaeota archaeon]